MITAFGISTRENKRDASFFFKKRTPYPGASQKRLNYPIWWRLSGTVVFQARMYSKLTGGGRGRGRASNCGDCALKRRSLRTTGNKILVARRHPKKTILKSLGESPFCSYYRRKTDDL